MIRFRYDGINHQGQQWVTSDAIRSLGEQVETEWPERRPQDGTVASKSHTQWPISDHGVDPNGGIVRAIDIGLPPDLAEALRLSRDPRLKYVIHKDQMFSSYPAHGFAPYTWRPYTKGGHGSHTHVSMLTVADNDDEPWEIGDDMAKAVEGIQRNLNDGGFADPPLTVDGDWGPKTEAAHLAMVEAAGAVPVVELEVEKTRVVKGVKIK